MEPAVLGVDARGVVVSLAFRVRMRCRVTHEEREYSVRAEWRVEGRTLEFSSVVAAAEALSREREWTVEEYAYQLARRLARALGVPVAVTMEGREAGGTYSRVSVACGPRLCTPPG